MAVRTMGKRKKEKHIAHNSKKEREGKKEEAVKALQHFTHVYYI